MMILVQIATCGVIFCNCPLLQISKSLQLKQFLKLAGI